MKVYLITAAAFAIVWLVAWFAFIRPTLKRYALTAGVLARIEAAEGSLWAKIKIALEAKKAIIVGFLGSGFAAAKAAIGLVAAGSVATAHVVGGLSPDDVNPLADKGLWTALVGESWALYIASAVTILGALLALKGHLTALKIVPADKA